MRLDKNRKDGRRGLTREHECVKEKELGPYEYINVSDEWMLNVVGERLQVGEMTNKYKKQVETFQENKLHGKFMRDVIEVADGRSWQWL